MSKKISSKKKTFFVIAVAIIAIYPFALKCVFSHQHLDIPRGDYPEVLMGEYQILNTSSSRIPDVFRGKKLSFRDNGDGRIILINEQEKSLFLTQGADGFYFSQDFSSSDAGILPGIARNWNEGRIRKVGDCALVEGYMLEKGLMLFTIPFKDVSRWHLELKKLPH